MSSLMPQRAFPSTQLNYLDGKLIRGFETNHPQMVDASLQLTHQLTLSEGGDETHFNLCFYRRVSNTFKRCVVVGRESREQVAL